MSFIILVEYFSFEAARNSEVWDLRYIWGGVERRRLGPSLYCTVQYLYITLNIRFASWAVLLGIECLRGTFDVRHLQDIIINNVDKTLLLGLPRKQNGRPIGYITLLSVISPLKHGVQRLWRLIYGLLTMAMLVGPLMGVKDPGKVQNRRVAESRIVLLILLLLIILLVKTFISRQLIHGCRCCSINNTNELCLLVSSAFWVKKDRREDKSVRKATVYGLELVCSSLRPNHYTTRTTG